GSVLAVDHGVDLFGCRHVRGGDGVVAKLRDADGLSVDGDAVDVAAAIGLARGSGLGEKLCQLLAVEPAYEDFGDEELRFWNSFARAPGLRAWVDGNAMQSDGGGVDVALGHDAGGVDKLLVLGAVAQRGGVEVGRGADGFEVHVDDRVRLGQQAG